MVQKVVGSIPISHPISFKLAPEGAFLVVLTEKSGLIPSVPHLRAKTDIIVKNVRMIEKRWHGR